MNVLITRELARDRAVGARRVATAFWIRILLAALGGLSVTALAPVLGYEREIVLFTLILSGAIVIQGVMTLGFAAIQGAEQMRRQAFVDILGKSLTLSVVVAVIVLDGGVVAYLLGTISVALILATLMYDQLRRAITIQLWQFSTEDAKYLARAGAPFWTASILLTAYPVVDIVLLSQLADARAVGILNAPTRIFSTLLFIPNIVSIVLFPQMARSFVETPERLERMGRAAFRLVISASVPLCILLIGLGASLLVLLLGDDFENSGGVVIASALGLVAMSGNVVVNRVLAAANRERMWMLVDIGGLVARIPLNIGLILLFDRLSDNPAVGVAVTRTAVEWGMLLVAIQFVPGGIVDRKTASHYAKLLAASAAAFAILLAVALYTDLGFAVAGVASVLGYAAAVALLRAHTMQELRDAIRWALDSAGGAPGGATDEQVAAEHGSRRSNE